MAGRWLLSASHPHTDTVIQGVFLSQILFLSSLCWWEESQLFKEAFLPAFQSSSSSCHLCGIIFALLITVPVPSTASWWLLGSEGKHCKCFCGDLSTPDVTSGSKQTSRGLSSLSHKPGGEICPKEWRFPGSAGNEGFGAGPFVLSKNEVISGVALDPS